MDKSKNTKPPQAFLRFFRWYCHPKLRNSIEGDLTELYHERILESGKKKADLRFAIDVLLLFRRGIIKPTEGYHSLNTYAMFKSYFKIGWRNLIKQKMFSAIKIGGFSLGIAACILIGLFIWDELSYDKYYPDANRIYRVLGVYNDNGQLQKGVHFQPPFAKAMLEDYAEIEKVGRYNNVELFGAANAEIRRADQDENLYEESITYFDQDLLDIFKLPFVYGNPSLALSKANSLVMTRSKAEKYFPHENPLGKMLIINDDKEHPYSVGGVIEDFPATSHLRFDFLLTLTGKEFWQGEQTSWCCSNYPTYVMLKPGVDYKELERKMTKGVLEKYIIPMMLKEGRTDAYEMVKKAHLELQPVNEIHLYSDGVQDGLAHGDIKFVWLFASVAGFILIIACINFINLSTAKSANRAREVGLRKVVGSLRSNLVNQFLAESLLYSVLSFVIGLMLASLLLPYFNILASKSLVLPLGYWWFVPGIFGASLIVGFFAGIYPSFYLSSFRPIQVLKGNLSLGSKSSSLRSALVVFQFTISIILIVGTFIIYRQMGYIINRKLGFEKDHVIYLEGTHMLGDKKIKTFKEELLKLSMVKSVSIGDYLPVQGTKRNGNQFFVEGKSKVEKPTSGQFWRVDHDYIKTMGMKMASGRDFDVKMASDSDAVVINQEMARKLGLKEAVGARIENYRGWNVIGVVEDFNFESLKQNIGPMAMVLGISPTIISIKLSAANTQHAIASITGLWKEFAPNQPVRFSFLDQSYARMYDDVQRMGKIFTSFALFAIIVACLGLFALSAFMVEQRAREIGIRIVLGASLKNIVRLLTQNFLKLVIISFLLAAPTAWYVMSIWLQDFVYRADVTWDIFALAGVLSMMIALGTVSYQAIRAALASPVTSLRSE
ncbi:MAG TPA: ABC transporter permease [Cyclobacteriaceae bacterium]|nr:ABC transporter permease [Cyclobacteriaceae bacterium]